MICEVSNITAIARLEVTCLTADQVNDRAFERMEVPEAYVDKLPKHAGDLISTRLRKAKLNHTRVSPLYQSHTRQPRKANLNCICRGIV